jgi:hypothetical protein
MLKNNSGWQLPTGFGGVRQGKWVNMDETMMDPGNGRTYYSLQQQKEGAEILLSTPYSVGCISETGNHWVLRAADGLPFGPVKVIAPAEGCLWFGTEKGAIKKIRVGITTTENAGLPITK